MLHARHGLNDFAGRIRERRIDPAESGLFRPQDAAREHALSREWLAFRLQAGALPVSTAAEATVVVTHHGPSSQSVAPMYSGSPLNPCFSSELPPGFFAVPALWIHGHTHASLDYRHHRTRVVANPRGYISWKGEVENRAFNPELVLTLQGERHG